MANGHGGKRAGAGRNSGGQNQKSSKVAKEAAAKGLTPVEFMLEMLRDADASLENRKWAAQHAAPYVHPRLAAIEQRNGGEDEKHEDWLERVAKKAGL
ncbi:hypothetical protein HBA54_27205 [Pelagibius litoralis]|uniref:Uncharacterized protein n=1 Tax=Pelagibius litoralis TaxID=374515 RepID=A0A967KGL6_9PROT|nr:hypothetical protein [Pelagibius litoralis]NIA72285.1 hypothetical protein [Pelagibius litoralis]